MENEAIEQTQENKLIENEVIEQNQENKPIEKTVALIYCGASIPGGILQQYSVFNNGLPEHLEDHINKCSAIKELFVETVDLVVTRNNVQKVGTRENMLYNETLKYGRG